MSWGSDILIDSDRDEQWNWLTRYALSHSDMLVCDSNSVRFKVQSMLPYPDERIVQFPWGIDLLAIPSGNKDLTIRQKLGWENQRVILSTRSWEEMYGIEVLLKAFRQAYKADSSLRLLLLATGSKRETVFRFITQNNLKDVVHCPGLIPNLELLQYYQTADVYVSCAHSDGTSISLLEAMGVGMPVVVTDISSNREWVTPEENGWLGIDDDPKSFARAILRAAHLSETDRNGISKRNRAVVAARANWGQNVEKLLWAYDRLLQK
jgi:glycosyltransferase involved in cell wall biosynthesis